MARGVLEKMKEGERAASPGMLHRHYAPRGEAVLVVGEDRMERAWTLYREAIAKGEKALIICPGAEDGPGIIGCDVLGENSLFTALHRADQWKIEKIILVGTDLKGENLAYMNRAVRAAGYHLEGGLI